MPFLCVVETEHTLQSEVPVLRDGMPNLTTSEAGSIFPLAILYLMGSQTLVTPRPSVGVGPSTIGALALALSPLKRRLLAWSRAKPSLYLSRLKGTKGSLPKSALLRLILCLDLTSDLFHQLGFLDKSPKGSYFKPLDIMLKL